MPNFKLKYEDSGNIRADCVSTVVFNLHQIKRRAFFGTPGICLASRLKETLSKCSLSKKSQRHIPFLSDLNIPLTRKESFVKMLSENDFLSN